MYKFYTKWNSTIGFTLRRKFCCCTKFAVQKLNGDKTFLNGDERGQKLTYNNTSTIYAMLKFTARNY